MSFLYFLPLTPTESLRISISNYLYRYNASTSIKSHFVDNQNLVVIWGDGDGISADTGNLL